MNLYINSLQTLYKYKHARVSACTFTDPFAEGQFVVVKSGPNYPKNVFCTPICDKFGENDPLVKMNFFDTVQDAMNAGNEPCEHCKPLEVKIFKVYLIIICNYVVNKSIGFNENRTIHPVDIQPKDPSFNNFRSAVLATRYQCAAAIELIYSDLDEKTLANEICSLEFYNPNQYPKDFPNFVEFNNSNFNKNRGGLVKGEILAKRAHTSRWHFHRVFKGICSDTPKEYGERASAFAETYLNYGLQIAANRLSFKIKKSNNGNKKINEPEKELKRKLSALPNASPKGYKQRRRTFPELINIPHINNNSYNNNNNNNNQIDNHRLVSVSNSTSTLKFSSYYDAGYHSPLSNSPKLQAGSTISLNEASRTDDPDARELINFIQQGNYMICNNDSDGSDNSDSGGDILNSIENDALYYSTLTSPSSLVEGTPIQQYNSSYSYSSNDHLNQEISVVDYNFMVNNSNFTDLDNDRSHNQNQNFENAELFLQQLLDTRPQVNSTFFNNTPLTTIPNI